MNRIALVGFMGAGKTTVGKLLAEKLRWCFFDSDEEMEKRTGSTVSELLSKDPEGFRRLEAETIRELLTEEQMVLATEEGA
ncbi:MAG TPA: shikimate kinase, partial [Bacillota bacterium]|nr:shikimate kinase [Bacillota bacterium]